MCGIVGILGKTPVALQIVDALKRLEYRGYDSAGVATLEDGGRLERRRAEGKLGNLEVKLSKAPLSGAIGIGHTRWATHGRPNEVNAHPHATEKLAVVHNGIIENFRELKDELRAQGVQVRLLGRREELPDATRASIESALAATAGGTRMRLNIAFNYAGRTELVDAVRSIVRRGADPETIDEATVAGALYTAGMPDPDLVIRTGGEHRLSNFLIWQSAYAELITSDTLWPDYGPEDLDGALAEYASRTRRFGR